MPRVSGELEASPVTVNQYFLRSLTVWSPNTGTMGFAIRKFPKMLYLGHGRLHTKEASKQCSGSVCF